MPQIFLNHLLRYLIYRRTKALSRPKMLSPILLLQVRMLFKQLARCATLDLPHDLVWRQRRRTTGQNVHVILPHHTFYYSDLNGFTGLSRQLSNSLRYFSFQYLVPVLRYPLQNDTQSGIPYDYRICIPCHPSPLRAACRS